MWYKLGGIMTGSMSREIESVQRDRRDQKRFASFTEPSYYGYKLKNDIVQFVVKRAILESGPSVFVTHWNFF